MIAWISKLGLHSKVAGGNDDDDDDETFRKSPAAQSESLDKSHWYEKNPKLNLGAHLSKTTVYKRGNLFTRTCLLDSTPLAGRNTVSS